jgi:hypothetical protein
MLLVLAVPVICALGRGHNHGGHGFIAIDIPLGYPLIADVQLALMLGKYHSGISIKAPGGIQRVSNPVEGIVSLHKTSKQKGASYGSLKSKGGCVDMDLAKSIQPLPKATLTAPAKLFTINLP